MVQKKKSDEQDVLVVRDEKTGEISVVAGLSRDGTPKRAPAKAENTPDFLRFDRNSDLMDSFFRNFYRQCKEPSRFGFYRIAADQVENLLGVMKELLKDPEANKEILSAHKVDTSNYEKEAKQSEGQAKETASSDDASKTQANTEKENVSSEQTNEKENDMEQKPEQTATEQQAQTAPGVKQNLISGNDVNLQELGAKYGIDFNSMNEKDMKALLNYGKTGLVIVKPTFGGEQIEIQARLSFRKDDNDQLQLVPHFVRNEPKLDVAYKGYTFTPEDKKNLLQNGNLGKVVDFPDKNTGELRPHFISIDRLTNEIVDIPTNKVRIPDTIGKTPITKDDKRVLYSGIPLRKEIELANGRKFTPLLQVNVEQRGVEFVPGSTRQAQGQKQNGDKKQTADKQEQKAEGDCVGDRTINKLSLFIVMFESAEMFEQVAKELKQNLIIDIDRDVDYQVWSRQETWTEHKLKGSPSGNTLTYESLHIDKFSTLANHMTGMLPPVPETSTDEKEDTKNRKGLTYTERDKFRETINNLTNQSVFNDQVLDYAIQKTLAKLCTALQSIKDNIESKHENILYENLYQKQYFYYTFLMGGDINDL